MSIVHIPFYPSDWLAGTLGLSDAEKGVYITLVARMYEMAGPIERDDDRLFRICGCKSKASFVKSLGYLISEGKIIVTAEGLFNEKAAKVIEQTTEKSSKAKAAAQSRWDRKPNKNKGAGNADASPKHMPQQCQPEPEPELYKKEDTKVSSQKNRASRLSEDWFLPSEWGEWALSEGWTKDAIRSEADKFKDYWNAKSGKDATKVSWQATWRNWMRNSKTPKGGKETGNGKLSIAERLEARFTEMDSGADRNPSEPLLQADSERGGGRSGNDGLDKGIVRLFAGGNQRCL